MSVVQLHVSQVKHGAPPVKWEARMGERFTYVPVNKAVCFGPWKGSRIRCMQLKSIMWQPIMNLNVLMCIIMCAAHQLLCIR